MASAVQGGTLFFDVQITGLDKIAGEFKAFAGDFAKDAEETAKKIEATTDGFDKFRNAVDATGDTLRIFGRESSLMADAIEDNISDPSLRAKLALERLQKEAGKTATAKRKLGDAVGLAKFRFFEFVGGVERGEAILGFAKGAVLGLSAAIGGGLVASLKLGIDANKRLSDSFEDLQTEGKVLVATFGQILLGGTKAKGGIDSLTDSVKGLNTSMKENATEIRDTFLGIAQGAISAVKYVGMAVLGVKTLFVGVGQALGALAFEFGSAFLQPIVAGFAGFTDFLKDKLVEMAQLVGPGEVQDNLLDYATTLMSMRNSAEDFGQTLASNMRVTTDWSVGFREGAEQIDAFTSGLDAANDALERLKGQKVNIDVSRQRLKGGGGGGNSAAEKARKEALERENQARALAGEALLTDSIYGDVQGPVLPPGRRPDEAMAAGFAGFGRATSEGMAKQIGDLTSVLGPAVGKMEAMFAHAEKTRAVFSDMGSSLKDTLINGFVDLAGAASQAAGAFLAGEGSLKPFGDSMLDFFGNLGAQIATIFFNAGTGMILMGNVGTGLALIGIGGALSLGAGALTAKGSANAGGGGGSRAARGVERAAARFERSEQIDTRDSRPMVLAIGGEEFRGYMYRQIEDGARRSRLRR